MRRYGWLLGLIVLLGVGAWLSRPDAKLRPGAAQAARALPSERVDQADPMPATRPPWEGAASAVADDANPAISGCTSAYQEAMRARLESPEAATDAHTQLIAAALAQMLYVDDPEEPNVRSGMALARARELAPEDTLVAWTAAMSCYPFIGCDRGEALDHLLRLEQDNAAAWLFVLTDAALREDQAAVDIALAGAARAPRYDSHFGDLSLTAMKWMHAVPYPRECSQAAAELGRRWSLPRPATQGDHVALMAMPMMSVESFSGIARACKPSDADASTQRVHDCVAVYARMAGSDALITRELAVKMLVQYTADLAEGAQWRERMRAQQWLMEQLRTPRTPADWAVDMFTLGEVPMLEATLARTGRWPPPQDWLPRNPRARALVTTGRPPPGMQ